VVHGAKVADLGREHGFSTATFRRWARNYGTPFFPYTPTEEDRRLASEWRAEPTITRAWNRYRSLAEDDRWSLEAELPNHQPGDGPDEFERLTLYSRPDARVLLVCEKKVVFDAVDHWAGPKRPSVAHASAAALARVSPLPSEWACRTLYDHAARMNAPILFFGDLDPQALHVFAALRAGGRDALMRGRVGRVPVQWVGLDSRWIDLVCKKLDLADVPVGWTIRVNWLGQEYWELVKRMVPDVRKLLGARGFAMLERGTKIEVDAFLSMLPAPFLQELGRRLRRFGA